MTYKALTEYALGDLVEIGKHPTENRPINNGENIQPTEWLKAKVSQIRDNGAIVVKPRSDETEWKHDGHKLKCWTLSVMSASLIRHDQIPYQVGDLIEVKKHPAHDRPIDNHETCVSDEWLKARVIRVTNCLIIIESRDRNRDWDEWGFYSSESLHLLRHDSSPTCSNQSSTSQPETNMTDKNNPTKTSPVKNLFTATKDNGLTVVGMLGAKQASLGARTLLLSFMEAKKMKKSWIKTASEMLATEKGTATISIIIGSAMRAIPQLQQDTFFMRVADAFQTQGMYDLGDELVEEVKAHFLPLGMQMLGLGQKMRVPGEAPSPLLTSLGLNLQEEEEEPSHLRAVPAARSC